MSRVKVPLQSVPDSERVVDSKINGCSYYEYARVVIHKWDFNTPEEAEKHRLKTEKRINNEQNRHN